MPSPDKNNLCDFHDREILKTYPLFLLTQL